MRLDKYLKVSRIIKRRTVAKEVADKGRIKVNGILAKSSTDLKVDDQVEIRFGNKLLLVKVLEMKDSTRRRCSMYEIISETRVEENVKNIVQMNNSFIQNEHQRRRYLMRRDKNEIVLWLGPYFDDFVVYLPTYNCPKL